MMLLFYAVILLFLCDFKRNKNNYIKNAIYSVENSNNLCYEIGNTTLL
jgi:hypothetical protein